MTVKIVTSHDEVHQCMCNLGCNLTVGGVPSQSKQAFIQRTTCLFARDQTCNKDGSDNKEFEAKLKEPVVAERIAKFRLFVSMVSFVRMAIKNVEWLHPDTAYAKVLWREWDAMLTDDFGMPRPQPRRQAKRMENLITMTVMEAVARVYLFKQSAAQFEEGRPEGFDDEGNPKLPSFEPGHLWAVLRTLVPSREVIYSAWSQGLEYTVGTSMHGVNVMTAMCQKVGISMTQCLKLNPTEDTSALLTKAEDVTYTCADLMGSADGRPTSEIETLARTLSRAREQRSAFRRMSDHQPGVAPAEAIRRVVEQKNSQLPDIDKIDATDVTNALYPTFAHAALYYKPQALIKWCNSKPFGGGTDLAPFFDTDPVTGSIRLHRFHARQSLAGESKVFDPAWIVVDSGISDERLLYAKAARTLMNGDSPCSTLGMHEEGVADTIMQLSTTENNQMCPEMPTMPSEMMPSRMFDDVSASTSDAPAPDRLGLREHSVVTPTGRKCVAAAKRVDDEAGSVDEDLRSSSHPFSAPPIHRELDRLVGRGRLPALLPAISTRCKVAPPVRIVDDALEINSGRAFEHAMMVTEAALALQTLPGVKNCQETLDQNAPGPMGTTARGATSLVNVEEGVTMQLSFSFDLTQIFFTLKAGEMLHTSEQAEELRMFNDAMSEHFPDVAANLRIERDDLPHMTMRYPGYQKYENNNTRDGRSSATTKLLSHPVRDCPQAERPVRLVESLAVESTISRDDIVEQVRTGIGREPEESDIETYVRLLAGSNYMHGVRGDPFDFTTWADFVKGTSCFNSNTWLDAADTAYNNAILGGETMLYARRLEADCTIGGEHSEYKLQPVTSGSTYAWRARHAPTHAGVHRLRNGETKRSFVGNDWNDMSDMVSKLGLQRLNPIDRRKRACRTGQR